MEESVANPSVKQSKTAVNANAKPGDPMPKLTTGGTAPSYEDLGGPTPENYKVDDDSAKLKTPGGNLKPVDNVVNNRKGKTGSMKAEEAEVEVAAAVDVEVEAAIELKIEFPSCGVKQNPDISCSL